MTLQDFAYTGNPITETSSGADLSRTILDRDGNTVATLQAEQYNGVAQLDYAAVLRTLFDDSVASVGTALKTSKHRQLQAEATINSTPYIFVRGVSRKQNYTPQTFKFLTGMPYLRHYAGFPLDVTYNISNGSAASWYVRLDGILYENQSALASMASVTKVHATSDLKTAPQGETVAPYIDLSYAGTLTRYYFAGQSGVAGRPYLWKTGANVEWKEMSSASKIPAVGDTIYTIGRPMQEWPYTVRAVADAAPYTFGKLDLVNQAVTRDTIQVREMPVPAHPFYVRWVNTKGGWDYFMFACNQKNTKQLSANDTFEPFGQYSTIYGERSAYHKAATSAVEVSTGAIDRQTLESVAELIFSPLIQLYDVELSTWIEIQVKDGKPEMMADQPTGELILSFELPTPQMNK